MIISERLKNFIKATNSFCVIVEDGKPSYVVSSFDWVEKLINPHDIEEAERVNSDINTIRQEEEDNNFPPSEA